MNTSLQRLNQSEIVRGDNLAPPTHTSMTVCLYEFSVVKQCVINITCKGHIFVFSNHMPFAQLILLCLLSHTKYGNFLSAIFLRFIGKSNSLHNFYKKIIFINDSCHTENYAQIMLAGTHGRSLCSNCPHTSLAARGCDSCFSAMGCCPAEWPENTLTYFRSPISTTAHAPTDIELLERFDSSENTIWKNSVGNPAKFAIKQVSHAASGHFEHSENWLREPQRRPLPGIHGWYS